MEMELIELTKNVLERVIAQGLFSVLSQKCQVSLEGIQRVFGALLEDKTDDELKALADRNKDAAWMMYVEMLTRISTQPLPDDHGDEKTALNSIYSLFKSTRRILKEYGHESPEFTKLAVLILNQKVRPFTTKWHVPSIEGAFEDKEKCDEFRDDLEELRMILCGYMQALAALAGVEDITEISEI